jgi:Periplasmic protein involved in polysaccharide export
MKTKTIFASVALLVAMFFSAAVPAADSDNAYRLRAGDSVLVSVWKDATLEKEVRVLPDGSITFPLAGRVPVVGLSTPEAEKRLAEKLKAFIADPEVSMVITGIEGNRIYVLGKVNKPGPVTLTAPTNVLQALSLAGGLDKFADGNDVQVLRTIAGRQELLSVRYNDLLKGRSLDTNVQLLSGDTVLVP